MSTVSNIDDLITSAVNCINEDNYIHAESIVNSILESADLVKSLTSHNWQFIAHICLSTKKFNSSKEAYIKANNLEGASFACILMEDFTEAKSLLQEITMSPAKLWCNFLIELFTTGQIKQNLPSFFTIRHFMEFTVYCLLLSEKYTYVHLFAKNLNKLLEINADAEKLIGYAYFHFGDCNKAITILNNSLKKDQHDGEIYFKLGQIYLFKNNLHEALSMLQNAKLLLPDHYATKVLLKKIEAML